MEARLHEPLYRHRAYDRNPSESEGRADNDIFFEQAVAEEQHDLDQAQSHGAAASG